MRACVCVWVGVCDGSYPLVPTSERRRRRVTCGVWRWRARVAMEDGAWRWRTRGARMCARAWGVCGRRARGDARGATRGGEDGARDAVKTGGETRDASDGERRESSVVVVFPFRRTARLDVACAYLVGTCVVLARGGEDDDSGAALAECGLYSAATALWVSRVAFDEIERRGLEELATGDGHAKWRVVVQLARAGDGFFLSAFLSAAAAVAFDLEFIGRVVEDAQGGELTSKVIAHRFLVYIPGIVVAALGTMTSALSFIADEGEAFATEEQPDFTAEQDGTLFETAPCVVENHYASSSCDEYLSTCEAETIRDQRQFVRVIRALRSFQAPMNGVASAACLATALGDKFEASHGAVDESFAACVDAIPQSFPAWLFLSANVLWIVELLLQQRMRCKLPQPSMKTSIQRMAALFLVRSK